MADVIEKDLPYGNLVKFRGVDAEGNSVNTEKEDVFDEIKSSSRTINGQSIFGSGDISINPNSLIIRKVYNSVSAMNSDGTSPVGSDGTPIKAGEIVSIYNSENSQDQDNNSIYSFQNPGWLQTGKLSQVDSELDETSTNPVENKVITKSIANIILDNMIVDDSIQPYGDSVVPDITTKKGYYSTSGKFVSDDNYTTKVFSVEEGCFYTITANTIGEIIYTLTLLDENENPIGGVRRSFLNTFINPKGISKIAIIGESSTILKYTDVSFKLKDKQVKANNVEDLAIGNRNIINKSVSIDKVDFTESKNLININSEGVLLGYYQAGGKPIVSSSFNLTDYIEVMPNSNYIYSSKSIVNVRFATFFRKDLSIHSYIENVGKITIPEDVYYIKLSIYDEVWDSSQFEIGNKATVYTHYKLLISKDVLSKTDIEDVTFSQIEFISKNILSPNKIVKQDSSYISTETGEISTGFGYGYTDYIPINEKGLVITGGYIAGVYIGHAVYDANKTFIRGERTNSIKYQEGDAFVRFSIQNVDEIMVEQSEIASSYEPYEGEKTVISKDVLPKDIGDVSGDNTIEISLPDKIYAVVGDTLQLFYRGIIQAVDPYRYNILVSCSKGRQFPRYFEYKPTISDVGTTTFRITVKDDNRNIIQTKECQLVTVNVGNSPLSELKVMCFGDSLTSAGTWCKEADRRLTESGGTPEGNQLTNIDFVGSKKAGNTGYFGVGGWTWKSYTTKGSPAYRFQVSGITSLSVGATYTSNGNTFTIQEVNVTEGEGNILCSVSSLTPAPSASGTLTKTSGNGDDSISYSSVEEDSQNPLWDNDNDKMSFIPYANKVSDGRIDVVYTLLSWNGQSAGRTDFSSVIAQVKIFADTLHAEFPNAKLKIMGIQVPSVNGGMGSSYGATGTSYADGYGMVVTALNQNKAYQDFANSDGYSDFVEFVNVSSQFDSEYNMPYKDNPVNVRNSSVTEKVGTNGVHPSENGYLQIGDIVYRNFIANFCQ